MGSNSLLMASATLFNQRCQQLRQDGFCVISHGESWGQRALQIEESCHLNTPIALDTCSEVSYRNEDMRQLLLGLLKHPEFSAFQTLGDGSQYPVCNMTSNNPLPAAAGLHVLVCSSDTEVIFYGGSHRTELDSFDAGNGWKRFRVESLETTNAQIIHLEKGGLVVADAQLGLQLVTGFLASYQFWVHDVREFLGFGKPRIRATSSFDLEGELERMRSEAQTHGLIFDLEIHDPRSK